MKKKEIFDDILDPFVWLDKYEPSRREPGQFYSNAECIDRLGMNIDCDGKTGDEMIMRTVCVQGTKFRKSFHVSWWRPMASKDEYRRTIMLLTAHDMMTCLDSVNLCDSGLNSGSAVHCSSIQEMAESRL